jgi:ParB-like chromosome segregation protein Spo0J
MNIQEIPIGDISPYFNNPRDNSEAVDVVVTSIKEFGFQVPIIMDKDNVIIAGHTRWEAAKRLGMETVPAIIAEGLTDVQAKAFRIMDNKAAEASQWDYPKLLKEFDDLESLDCSMDSLGFDLLEIENLRVDFENPTQKKPIEKQYEMEDDEDNGRPNFNPTLNPEMTNKQVTDKDLDQAKNKLEVNQESKKTLEVICPECYHEFEIGA